MLFWTHERSKPYAMILNSGGSVWQVYPRYSIAGLGIEPNRPTLLESVEHLSHLQRYLAKLANQCLPSAVGANIEDLKYVPKDLNFDLLVWNQQCCRYTKDVNEVRKMSGEV